MIRYIKCLNQKRILSLILIIIITFCIYSNSSIKKPPPILLHHHQNVTFKNVSIAHYTTLYNIRTDSHSKRLNENLKQICHILDPEDYAVADHVFVSLVDLTHLPSLFNYRHLHQSQLWIVHSEESPRNSYGKIQIKDLDDWFNLTSTLKPESDFHLQYRVEDFL